MAKSFGQTNSRSLIFDTQEDAINYAQHIVEDALQRD